MSYTTKSVLIVLAVAVVSYFVANAVLPEKGDVLERESHLASEQSAPHAEPPSEAAPAPAPAPAPVAVAPAPTPAPAPPPAKAPAPAPVPAPAVAAPAAPPPVGVPPVGPRVRWGWRDDAHPPQKIGYFEFPDPRYQAPRTPVDTVIPPPPAPEPPAPRPQRQGASPLRIAQAAVCTDVVSRSPVGASTRFSRATPKLFYYTHVTGASETDTGYVAHRWYRDGKLVQTKVRPIASASWRTHSNRVMEGADDVGSWRIDAVDNKTGTVLETTTFVVE
ncbi:MAG: DUF2914 domain-containing protein [Chitinispirillia bacterium]|nr:DUF2914 domain-containing protein [Chitinispirillia bacterium]MCL2241128.1 DUF2914 domain-containing protein [Chitinispirillia bacterium]